jgi:predicted polyphosphate/ATP-dependent NAD kinase
VNPVAGLGGRVGLKGSDGAAIQQKARELGAVPHSVDRAAQALAALVPLRGEFELLTCPGAMGADAARQAGLPAQVTGPVADGVTTAADTVRAAREMVIQKIDLLLFAGGDGTARDICSAIGTQVPALGIPAGVKIHSAVYATHPRSAGELAAAFLRGGTELRQAEVMDLDEDAFRAGRVSPRLYGVLTMPYLRRYVQGVKAPSALSEPAALEAIAEDVARRGRGTRWEDRRGGRDRVGPAAFAGGGTSGGDHCHAHRRTGLHLRARQPAHQPGRDLQGGTGAYPRGQHARKTRRVERCAVVGGYGGCGSG